MLLIWIQLTVNVQYLCKFVSLSEEALAYVSKYYSLNRFPSMKDHEACIRLFLMPGFMPVLAAAAVPTLCAPYPDGSEKPTTAA